MYYMAIFHHMCSVEYVFLGYRFDGGRSFDFIHFAHFAQIVIDLFFSRQL